MLKNNGELEYKGLGLSGGTISKFEKIFDNAIDMSTNGFTIFTIDKNNNLYARFNSFGSSNQNYNAGITEDCSEDFVKIRENVKKAIPTLTSYYFIDVNNNLYSKVDGEEKLLGENIVDFALKNYDNLITLDKNGSAYFYDNEEGTYEKIADNIKKISNSCRKLVEYNFSYEEAGSKIYFNLFDNIVIKEDVERPYAIAQFGEILSNAIIKKKLISITSASYDVLDNNLSRIICYAMKREQISNQETFIGEYNYTYFQKIVRFKLKNKKKNLQLIKESLQEFVDNNIVIDSFELKNNVFIIKFLPLSDAEIQDLNFDKTKLIDMPSDIN